MWIFKLGSGVVRMIFASGIDEQSVALGHHSAIPSSGI